MRFGHIELFCSDTERTRAFYVDSFGFELTVEQPGGFIWLKNGPIELLLRPSDSPPPAALTYQSGSQAIVLYTDHLDQALAELAAREIVPQGDDGPGCPVFRDPDGRWIQVVENPED